MPDLDQRPQAPVQPPQSSQEETPVTSFPAEVPPIEDTPDTVTMVIPDEPPQPSPLGGQPTDEIVEVKEEPTVSPEPVREALQPTQNEDNLPKPTTPEVVKPQLERDPKTGLITKGVAQDTNKNGTVGRPCEFCKNKEEILKKTRVYYDTFINAPGGKMSGEPLIEELALMVLDVDEGTISHWANKIDEKTKELEHPEFNLAYKKLNTLQKMYLLKRTIGRYNPTGAIFQLKVNHGAIETEKRVLAGDKNEPIQVEIIEDKPTLPNE